jgi:hypothetical protein
MLLSFFHCTIFCEDISEASKNLSRRHRWMSRVYSYSSWKYLILNREVNEVGDKPVPTISQASRSSPSLSAENQGSVCSGGPIRKVLIKIIRVLRHADALNLNERCTQETPMGIASSVSSAAGDQSGHSGPCRTRKGASSLRISDQTACRSGCSGSILHTSSEYKLSSLILRVWRSLW